jgi:hypothetical protein
MYTRARSASAAAGVRTPCSACSGALHRRGCLNSRASNAAGSAGRGARGKLPTVTLA